MPSSLLGLTNHWTLSPDPNQNSDGTDTIDAACSIMLIFPGFPSSCTEIFLNHDYDIHGDLLETVGNKESNSCMFGNNLKDIGRSESPKKSSRHEVFKSCHESSFQSYDHDLVSKHECNQSKVLSRQTQQFLEDETSSNLKVCTKALIEFKISRGKEANKKSFPCEKQVKNIIGSKHQTTQIKYPIKHTRDNRLRPLSIKNKTVIKEVSRVTKLTNHKQSSLDPTAKSCNSFKKVNINVDFYNQRQENACGDKRHTFNTHSSKAFVDSHGRLGREYSHKNHSWRCKSCTWHLPRSYDKIIYHEKCNLVQEFQRDKDFVSVKKNCVELTVDCEEKTATLKSMQMLNGIDSSDNVLTKIIFSPHDQIIRNVESDNVSTKIHYSSQDHRVDNMESNFEITQENKQTINMPSCRTNWDTDRKVLTQAISDTNLQQSEEKSFSKVIGRSSLSASENYKQCIAHRGNRQSRTTNNCYKVSDLKNHIKTYFGKTCLYISRHKNRRPDSNCCFYLNGAVSNKCSKATTHSNSASPLVDMLQESCKLKNDFASHNKLSSNIKVEENWRPYTSNIKSYREENLPYCTKQLVLLNKYKSSSYKHKKDLHSKCDKFTGAEQFRSANSLSKGNTRAKPSYPVGKGDTRIRPSSLVGKGNDHGTVSNKILNCTDIVMTKNNTKTPIKRLNRRVTKYACTSSGLYYGIIEESSQTKSSENTIRINQCNLNCYSKSQEMTVSKSKIVTKDEAIAEDVLPAEIDRCSIGTVTSSAISQACIKSSKELEAVISTKVKHLNRPRSSKLFHNDSLQERNLKKQIHSEEYNVDINDESGLGKQKEPKRNLSSSGLVSCNQREEVPLFITSVFPPAVKGCMTIAASYLGKAKNIVSKARSKSLSPILAKIKDLFARDLASQEQDTKLTSCTGEITYSMSENEPKERDSDIEMNSVICGSDIEKLKTNSLGFPEKCNVCSTECELRDDTGTDGKNQIHFNTSIWFRGKLINTKDKILQLTASEETNISSDSQVRRNVILREVDFRTAMTVSRKEDSVEVTSGHQKFDTLNFKIDVSDCLVVKNKFCQIGEHKYFQESQSASVTTSTPLPFLGSNAEDNCLLGESTGDVQDLDDEEAQTENQQPPTDDCDKIVGSCRNNKVLEVVKNNNSSTQGNLPLPILQVSSSYEDCLKDTEDKLNSEISLSTPLKTHSLIKSLETADDKPIFAGVMSTIEEVDLKRCHSFRDLSYLKNGVFPVPSNKSYAPDAPAIFKHTTKIDKFPNQTNAESMKPSECFHFRSDEPPEKYYKFSATWHGDSSIKRFGETSFAPNANATDESKKLQSKSHLKLDKPKQNITMPTITHPSSPKENVEYNKDIEIGSGGQISFKNRKYIVQQFPRRVKSSPILFPEDDTTMYNNESNDTNLGFLYKTSNFVLSYNDSMPILSRSNFELVNSCEKSSNMINLNKDFVPRTYSNIVFINENHKNVYPNYIKPSSDESLNQTPLHMAAQASTHNIIGKIEVGVTISQEEAQTSQKETNTFSQEEAHTIFQKETHNLMKENNKCDKNLHENAKKNKELETDFNKSVYSDVKSTKHRIAEHKVNVHSQAEENSNARDEYQARCNILENLEAETFSDICNSCLSDKEPDNVSKKDKLYPSVNQISKCVIVPTTSTSQPRKENITLNKKKGGSKFTETKSPTVKPVAKLHHYLSVQVQNSKHINTITDYSGSSYHHKCSNRHRTTSFDSNKKNPNLISEAIVEPVKVGILNPRIFITGNPYTITLVSTVFGAREKNPKESKKENNLKRFKTNSDNDTERLGSDTTDPEGSDTLSAMATSQEFASDTTKRQTLDHKSGDQSLTENLSEINSFKERNCTLPISTSESSSQTRPLSSSSSDAKLCGFDSHSTTSKTSSMDIMMQSSMFLNEFPITFTTEYTPNKVLSLFECFGSRVASLSPEGSQQVTMSKLSQRIRRSYHGSVKNVDFVSRSKRHLEKCELLIQRSAEIIKRSRELTCYSQRQMEYTAEKMNLQNIRPINFDLDIRL